MLTKLAGLAGVFAPILTLTFIFVSIALSPWFSWHDNALSDMGVDAVAPLFNGALLIGGLLYFVFVIGFLRWRGLRSRLAKLAAVAMLSGAIGLFLIGVFTEDAGRTHYYVAATYFLATPVAYGMLGSDWVRQGVKLMGWLTVATGITAFLMIAVVPHKRIAVPEILAALTMGMWTFALGLKLLIEPNAKS